MDELTARQLADLGVRIDRAQTFAPVLSAAMAEYEINTPARQAAFLAQVLHESGLCRWLVELWGPTATQLRYEVRQDLGNCQPGDGFKYRGRGLIQLTGRGNYQKAGDALGANLIDQPELLGEPQLASRSAGWYWNTHGCNELADAGEFETITRRVNGALNGYPERLALWDAAKQVLA